MTVNNDIRILRGCKMLYQEIDYLNNKIKQEQVLLTGRGVPISDMPRGGGAGKDTYDELDAILQLRDERRRKILDYVDQTIKAERILAGVADPLLRMTYRLLYVEKMPVWKVAREVNMSQSSIERRKADAEMANSLLVN